jgi:hypothetical protein
MQFQYNDGGRAQAGYKGLAADCVVRSIAIATDRPYQEVYDAINGLAASMRQTKRARGSSARTGVYRQVYDKYLRSLGWEFVPTMGIGTGCRVHLCDGELPMSGRIICRLSRHMCAVVDGVIHDTHDPQRDIAMFVPDHGQVLGPNQGRNQNGVYTMQRRCVYGYWRRVEEKNRG